MRLPQTHFGQAKTHCDLYLSSYQVEASDLFCDRVLHLQPSISLNKHKSLIGRININEKLEGTETKIVMFPSKCQCCVSNLFPQTR